MEMGLKNGFVFSGSWHNLGHVPDGPKVPFTHVPKSYTSTSFQNYCSGRRHLQITWWGMEGGEVMTVSWLLVSPPPIPLPSPPTPPPPPGEIGHVPAWEQGSGSVV